MPTPRRRPTPGSRRRQRPALARAMRWLELLTADLSTSQGARVDGHCALLCWLTPVAQQLPGAPRSMPPPRAHGHGKRTAARQPVGQGGCGPPGLAPSRWASPPAAAACDWGSPKSAEPGNFPPRVPGCPPASPRTTARCPAPVVPPPTVLPGPGPRSQLCFWKVLPGAPGARPSRSPQATAGGRDLRCRRPGTLGVAGPSAEGSPGRLASPVAREGERLGRGPEPRPP